jgi:carbon-monoxide dehydrogenase medium subunit
MARTFQYLRPTTPEEACEMKAEYGRAARFWAGGTDLMLDWRAGAEDIAYCIDLSYLSELDYARTGDRYAHIGSLTKVASLGRFADQDIDVNGGFLALGQAARTFASPQIRNMATVGGNLCYASPSADLATPLLVLNAEAKLASRAGARFVALESFFQGVNETAMRDDELMVEIRFPIPVHETVTNFQKLGRTMVDIALVNAAARLTRDGEGQVAQARIALGAVAPVPMRCKAAEELVAGAKVADITGALLDQVSSRAAADARPITDIRASAGYRRRLCQVLVRRALEEVVQKLGGRIA